MKQAVVWGMGMVMVALALCGAMGGSLVRAGTDTCKSVVVIYARGSGQPLGSNEERRFMQGVIDRVGPSDRVGYFELSRLMPNVYGNYPAVGIDGRPSGDARVWTPQLLNALDAKLGVSWLGIGRYNHSVDQGRELLFEFLTAAANKTLVCKTTRLVLAGYSQGAQVIGDALADERMRAFDEMLLSVQLLGDPRLNYHETLPTAKVGSWYRGTADDQVVGLLGARGPYLPLSVAHKTGSWCRDQDGVCSNTLFMDEHIRYAEREVGLAAREAGLAIKAYLRSAAVAVPGCDPDKQDIVMALDLSQAASGSGFFEPAVLQAEATSLLANGCSTRLAAVGFYPADQHQAPVALTNFVTSPESFTAALESRLTAPSPRLVQSQLREGLLKAAAMNWRPDANKLVIAHTKSQLSGWHGTTDIVNQQDDSAIDALRDDPLTKQVAKVFADNNIAFRYTIAALQPGDSRSYKGDETQPLRVLTELLGGRPVSNGCSRYCYWRLLGTLGDMPALRAVPIEAAVGQDFSLRTVDLSDGRIAAAKTAHNLTYQWDLDGDGLFEISGGQEADGEAPLRLEVPRSGQGHVRVMIGAGMDENRVTYDSYTATLPIHIGPLARPPTASIKGPINVTLEANHTIRLSWRPVSAAEHYVVSNEDGFIAATNQTELRLYDVPDGQAIRLAVRPANAAGPGDGVVWSSWYHVDAEGRLAPGKAEAKGRPTVAELPSAAGLEPRHIADDSKLALVHFDAVQRRPPTIAVPGLGAVVVAAISFVTIKWCRFRRQTPP